MSLAKLSAVPPLEIRVRGAIMVLAVPIGLVYPYLCGIQAPLFYVAAALLFYISLLGAGVMVPTNGLKRLFLDMVAVLSFIGFVLKFAVIRLDEYSYSLIRFGGTGMFDFRDESHTAVLLIATTGLFGTYIGIIFASEKTPAKSSSSFLGRTPPQVSKRFMPTIILWFLTTWGIDVILWFLQIGQMGTSYELQFRLIGAVYYFRLVVVPIIGFLLLDSARKFGAVNEFRYIIYGIFIGAVICQFASLSRGVILARVFPVFLYLFYTRQLGLFRGRLLTYIGVVALIISVAGTSVLVTEFRNTVWGAGDKTVNNTTALDNIGEFLSVLKVEQRAYSYTSEVRALILARATGIQELMAVYAARDVYEFNLSLFAKLFYDGHYLAALTNEGVFMSGTFNSSAASSPGFIGLFFYSGSLWVVFFGPALCSYALFRTCAYFYDLGQEATAFCLALTLILLLWGAGFANCLIAAVAAILSFRTFRILSRLLWRS